MKKNSKGCLGSFKSQPADRALNFCFRREIAGIGFAEALPDVIDLPLVNYVQLSGRVIRDRE
jgi:hypothetical protein